MVRSPALWEPASIITNPFLEYAFQTTAFEMTMTINDNGSWAYDQTTTLNVRGETRTMAMARLWQAKPLHSPRETRHASRLHPARQA